MKDSAQNTKTPLQSDPVIEAYMKDIDRSLIRENLRLTVDQRFQKLMELQRFAEELQYAGRSLGNDSNKLHRTPSLLPETK